MLNVKCQIHIPVLKNEVIKYLNPRPNQNFVDCTFGQGGHSLAILEKIKPKGKVLGIELDQKLYREMKKKIKEKRLILVRNSYKNLEKIIKKRRLRVNGILFDLGLSSWHLEKSKRGFSFKRNEILDMRYDLENTLTAEKILNEWSEKEIEEILKKYGQERFAKKIAKEILKKRPIKKTFELVEAIKKATPNWYQRKKIHFATKTFQALRIAVNDELENLKIALPQALEILERKGKLLVISYHSLEDKIVKNFFKENSKKNFLKILTKKPIRPSPQEIKRNPRSRSAKLRAAMKL